MENQLFADALAIARTYLERESDRDMAAVRETLTDDFVFESPLTATGLASSVEGADVFCGHLAKYVAKDSGWYSAWEFYDVEVHPVTDGKLVFAEWKSRAVIASTGAPYGNTYIGVFKIRDGRICLLREYRDPHRVTTALAGKATTAAA